MTFRTEDILETLQGVLSHGNHKSASFNPIIEDGAITFSYMGYNLTIHYTGIDSPSRKNVVIVPSLLEPTCSFVADFNTLSHFKMVMQITLDMITNGYGLDKSHMTTEINLPTSQ